LSYQSVSSGRKNKTKQYAEKSVHSI